MTQPDLETPGAEREELLAQRKRQVWLIVLVMTVSSCIGSAILIYLLWLLFRNLTP